MKLLVGIISCKRDEESGQNDTVRETWFPDSNRIFETRFFIGQSDLEPKPDTIKLDCPDDYQSLPHKVKAMTAYAVARGFEFLYKCDRDTYVVPGRLRALNFTPYDYYGHFPLHPVDGPITSPPDPAGHYVYASGGCGYILSRRAMDVLVQTEVTDWAEDRWVGDTMAKNKIMGYHDSRFWFKPGAHTCSPYAMIACHLSRGTDNYNQAEMRQLHGSFLGQR